MKSTSLQTRNKYEETPTPEGQKKEYKVTIRVTNEVGVLARISTLLRKFNVNIRSMDAAPIDNEDQFTDIHFVIESSKHDIRLVAKKLERLIPVILVKINQ